MNKVLTVYLNPHADHPDVVNKFIFTYKGHPLEMNTDQISEFISLLPEFWHSENDKLILFTSFSDGNYYCEREKTVYNYATKIFEKVPYVFDATDEEKVNEFTKILIEYFESIQIERQKDIQQQILSEIQNYSIIQNFVLNTRENVLSKTDYLFIGDYPISEEKKIEWSKYRQEWRDITKQEAWENGEIHKVLLPVSPEEKNQFTYNIMKEMGQIDNSVYNYIETIKNDDNFEDKMNNIINRYCEYLIKQHIVMALSRLKLPLLDMNLNNFYSEAPTDEDFLANFSEFSEKIDEQLKRIGTDLTVSSLISHYRNMSGSSISQEVIDILEELNKSAEGDSK